MVISDFIKVPITEAETPKNGCKVFVDYYWLIHDDCLLIWNKGGVNSHQCNIDKRLSEMICIKYGLPGVSVQKIPLAFIPGI